MQTIDATIEPVFKIGCRVEGKIHLYFVEKCDGVEMARAAVKSQVPGANPIIGLLISPTRPVVKERA